MGLLGAAVAMRGALGEGARAPFEKRGMRAGEDAFDLLRGRLGHRDRSGRRDVRQKAAKGEIVGQIRDLVGQEGATAIQSLIQSANRQGTGSLATLIGLLVLLFGSTSAFSQVQTARFWSASCSASHWC